MTEVATIENEELAVLCDIVSGWGMRKWAGSPGAVKKQALDRLIAHGYVEPVYEGAATSYRHTAKAEVLLAELCVGISGG
jgi:glutamine synthetase